MPENPVPPQRIDATPTGARYRQRHRPRPPDHRRLPGLTDPNTDRFILPAPIRKPTTAPFTVRLFPDPSTTPISPTPKRALPRFHDRLTPSGEHANEYARQGAFSLGRGLIRSGRRRLAGSRPAACSLNVQSMDVRIDEDGLRAEVQGLGTGVHGYRFPNRNDGDTGLPHERPTPDGGGAGADAPSYLLVLDSSKRYTVLSIVWHGDSGQPYRSS